MAATPTLKRSSFLTNEPVHKKDIDTVIQELNQLKNELPNKTLSSPRRRGSSKFWQSILDDIHEYKEDIDDKNPLHGTCYERCPRCASCYDKTYYQFKLVGYRKRQSPKIYKEPMKSIALLFTFFGGLFKILRANQDGAVSFYGTILTIVSHFLTFFVLISDEQYMLAIPKMAGFGVAIGILYGILSNAENGVGL